MDINQEQFPTAVVCDPEGDIRLIVSEERRQILASSVVMRLSSKVFKAMLGPNFKEGNELRSISSVPYDLPLPEDSYEGMAILCLYLHLQPKTTEALWQQTKLQIEDFLLLIDKYECYAGIQPTLSGHLKNVREKLMIQLEWEAQQAAQVAPGLSPPTKPETQRLFERIMGLVKLFYRICDAQQFSKFSTMLILHYKGSLFDLKLKHDAESDLPIEFYAGLDLFRSRAQQQLADGIYLIVSQYPRPSDFEELYAKLENVITRNHGMSFDSLFRHVHYGEDVFPALIPHLKAFAVIYHFRKIDTFPPDFTRFSVAQILKRMWEFYEYDALNLYGNEIRKEMVPCLDSECQDESVLQSIERLNAKVRRTAQGMCLECLKANRNLGEEKECCP